MFLRSTIYGFFALGLLGACATTPDVKVDSDPGANFERYRTYSMVLTSAPAGVNPLVFERVQNKIDSQFASRGYVKAEPADFAVGFTIGARDKVNVDDFGPYAGGFGRYGYRGWGGYSSVNVYETREGSLSIDVFDVQTKKPVWFATTTSTIRRDGVSDAQINEAISAIVAKFPSTRGTTAAAN